MLFRNSTPIAIFAYTATSYSSPMLISDNLNLWRVLRYTWKVDLIIIVICAATYYLHPLISPLLNQIPPTLVALLGSALAFFIGFNNNQAYDRWLEARAIWGAIVNDSRSWARNILHYTSENNPAFSELRHGMVRRHLAYVYALKAALRGTPDPYYKKYLTDDELARVSRETNLPNAILSLNAMDLQRLAADKTLDALRFIQINEFITSFTEHMGRCERIKGTVFPITYVYFTKLFIWLLVVGTTLILSTQVDGWSIMIGWVIGFVFHVSHQNGMTLMEPFQETPYCVPLNQIARTIEINLLEMLGEEKVPAPIKAVDGEYVL